MNSLRRSLCWISISRSRCLCWWTGWSFLRRLGRGLSMRLRRLIGKSGEVIFEIPGSEAVPADAGGGARATQATILRFAQRFECKDCSLRYEEPEPRLFSFNNPYGACPRCQGFGNTIDFDLDLVIPDKMKTLAEGPIEPWTKPKYRPLFTDLKRFAKAGGDSAGCAMGRPGGGASESGAQWRRKFLGVRGFFAHLERKKYKLHVRVFLSRYRGYSLCPDCNGSRLRLEARQVKIKGENICEVCCADRRRALQFFEQVQLSPAGSGDCRQGCWRRFASGCVS